MFGLVRLEHICYRCKLDVHAIMEIKALLISSSLVSHAQLIFENISREVVIKPCSDFKVITPVGFLFDSPNKLLLQMYKVFSIGTFLQTLYIHHAIYYKNLLPVSRRGQFCLPWWL